MRADGGIISYSQQHCNSHSVYCWKCRKLRCMEKYICVIDELGMWDSMTSSRGSQPLTGAQSDFNEMSLFSGAPLNGTGAEVNLFFTIRVLWDPPRRVYLPTLYLTFAAARATHLLITMKGCLAACEPLQDSHKLIWPLSVSTLPSSVIWFRFVVCMRRSCHMSHVSQVAQERHKMRSSLTISITVQIFVPSDSISRLFVTKIKKSSTQQEVVGILTFLISISRLT